MEKNNDLIKFTLGFLVTIFGFILIFQLINSQKYNMEMEGSCDSGNIGVDFESKWENQPYKDNITISQRCDSFKCINRDITITRYHEEWLPDHFNINGIEGINCNFKVKGEVPLFIIKQNLISTATEKSPKEWKI